MQLLEQPTRFLFFTGKGGVGKTSIACAAAIALADPGSNVLLVSTDPASNLDEMLAVELADAPRPVPGVPGLSAMNIDPETEAEAYRERVLAPMRAASSDAGARHVREQLSGACTTEIAAFDAFAGLLADDAAGFDHVVFDTAPTGHTLRLLSLPKAWTGFLEGNDRGAACLGPHSGLKMREARFAAALAALADPARTRIVLVTRADRAALARGRAHGGRAAAARAHQPVSRRQRRVHGQRSRPIRWRRAVEAQGAAALADDAGALAGAAARRGTAARRRHARPRDPARACCRNAPPPPPRAAGAMPRLPGLAGLVDELAAAGHGLIMVMGKGGVGKTTIAAAIAVGLVERGHGVHLSTTDPAAHLAATLAARSPGCRSTGSTPRPRPSATSPRSWPRKGKDLDEHGRALLREDLRSPCTEEVAVFHAFSRIVAEARSASSCSTRPRPVTRCC